jgi:rubrerythrin
MSTIAIRVSIRYASASRRCFSQGTTTGFPSLSLMAADKGTILERTTQFAFESELRPRRFAGWSCESEKKTDQRGGVMDVYDYAMQLEKDGETYYRDGAARSINKGLKHILNMLADAEVKHYNILSQMKGGAPVELGEATILKDAKNIFVQMREEGDFGGSSVSEIDLYKGAQEIEKKTENFYREKAVQVGDAVQQEVLLRMAKEENKHYFILEQVIDFVSRPDHWLENAEFYHLDEY